MILYQGLQFVHIGQYMRSVFRESTSIDVYFTVLL